MVSVLILSRFRRRDAPYNAFISNGAASGWSVGTTLAQAALAAALMGPFLDPKPSKTLP